MDLFRARDGFVGSVIGHYITREGEPGLVLQQQDTKVVHVYRVASLEALQDSYVNGPDGLPLPMRRAVTP